VIERRQDVSSVRSAPQTKKKLQVSLHKPRLPNPIRHLQPQRHNQKEGNHQRLGSLLSL
jgi:hypothetical protein